MMKMRRRNRAAFAVAVASGMYGMSATTGLGQTGPIALTNSGFNQNLVYTGSDSPSIGLDIFNNYDLYVTGFPGSSGYGYGLPTTNNETFTSATTAATTFQFQPYANNNALLLTYGGYGGQPNTGTLTFTSPGYYSGLSFLVTDTNQALTVSYTINFTNNTTQTGTYSSLDWYTGGKTAALKGVGRAGAGGAVDTGTADTDPFLYEVDVSTSASQSLQIASVTFSTPTAGSTYSAAAIFAISGTQLPLIYTGNALAGTWDTVSQNFNTPAGSPTTYSDGLGVQFVDSPSGGANINIPNPVNPFAVVFTNNSSNYSLTGGPIGGSASLSLKGTASVTLNSSNTYTGATNVSAGKLFLASNGSIASAVVYVGSGAGMYLQTANPLTGMPAVTDNGTFNLSGATATIASLAGSGALSIDATSSLSLAGGTFNGSLNLLSGGSFTDTGTGTLALGAVNLYGTVNVNAGTLQLSQTGSNFSGGHINIGSSGTLALIAGGTGQLVATDINSILTDSVFGSGSLLSMNYSSTTAPLTISSGFSGIGFTKLGAGTVVLSGTNSITGPLTDSAGTLVLGPGTTFSGKLAAVAANTTLNLNGASGTFTTFAGTAKGVLTNTNTLLSSITVGTGGGSTFAGNISGNIAINFASTGTIILSGSTNSYTGSTNISSGILELNSAASLSPNSTVIFGGGQLLYESTSKVLDASKQASQSANQYFNINTSSQSVAFASGLNSSGGNLNKLGSGTLTLTGTSNYTGFTNVSAGTLTLGAANILPSTTNVSVTGTLGLSTFNESVNGVTLVSGSITGTTTVLTDATTYNLATGTVTAGLAGTQGLLKSGAGTVTLTDTDTVAGAVNLSGGTLLFNSAGAFSPSFTSVLFDGGTLEYSAGYTADSSAIFSTAPGQTFNLNTNGQNVKLATGLVSAGGTLNKLGTGTLTLNGTSTYSGTTTITAGTLQLGVPNAINSASGLAMAGGTLDLNGNPATFSSLNGASGTITNSATATATLTIPQPVGTSSYLGSISDGNGKVTTAFVGPGNQTLGGLNSYSGGTLIKSGTVTASSNTALGTGPVTLNTGTLALALPGSNIATVINGISQGSGATQLQVNTLPNSTVGAAQGISGSTLTLTDGSGGEALSAFTNAPLPLGTGFVAKFVYTASASGSPADGMTFTLQNSTLGASAVGGGGGFLGYAGISGPSVAVAFNIYPIDDGSANNVGESLQYNGNLSNFFNDVTGDNSPFTGTLYDFGDEAVNVTITYNAVAQTLSEILVGSLDGGTYTNTYTGVNLASDLGANSAYVGFTGATGGVTSTQTITGFTFGTSNPGPANIANNITATAGTHNTIQLGVYSGFIAGGIGSLNIGTGATVTVAALSTDGIANRGVLAMTGLSISGATGGWTGLLDITNNSLDVQNGSPTVLATITNQTAQGYARGTWQGSGGIVSSTAAADTAHLTAVGVILNDTNQAGGGTLLYGNSSSGVTGGISATFDGAAAAMDDVLVKYTYYGDANLDGAVDGSDYALIDATYAAENFSGGVTTHPVSGWYNGDFNYDGVVNGSDYTLMDNAYNQQGLSLGVNPLAQSAISTALVAGGGSAVPEPSTIALLAVGAAATLSRRRRRSGSVS